MAWAGYCIALAWVVMGLLLTTGWAHFLRSYLDLKFASKVTCVEICFCLLIIAQGCSDLSYVTCSVLLMAMASWWTFTFRSSLPAMLRATKPANKTC